MMFRKSLHAVAMSFALGRSQVLALKLQQMGFPEVAEAEDGQEALQAIQEAPFVFSAILMDVCQKCWFVGRPIPIKSEASGPGRFHNSAISTQHRPTF